MSEYVTIHMCPPKGSGAMPCCGLPPFERRSDRMTLDPEDVTCGIADFAAADQELAEGRTVELSDLLPDDFSAYACTQRGEVRCRNR